MPLYNSRGEYLTSVLERLIEAVDNFTETLDYAKQGFVFDEYRERRDLDDEIKRAKEALHDEGMYESGRD